MCDVKCNRDIHRTDGYKISGYLWWVLISFLVPNYPKFSCVEELSHQLVPPVVQWSPHATTSVDADMGIRGCTGSRCNAERWTYRRYGCSLVFCRDERWEDSGEILVSVTVTRFRTGLPIKFQYPRSPHNGKSGATRSFRTTSQGFDVYMLCVAWARPTNSPKILLQGNEDTNCICKFQWILFYKLLGRLPQGNQYKSIRLACWELAWAVQVSCFSLNRSWLP